MPNEPKTPSRILRIRQVQERTGLGRSTIYDRLDRRSRRFDEAFPKPVKIGISAVGWLEADVERWIDRQVKMSSAKSDSSYACH